MAIDDVIANLVRDLKPVRPLRLPRERLASWALVVALTLTIVAAVIGLRVNIRTSLWTMAFQAHSLLLVLCAASAAAAALMLIVPGELVSWWRRLAPVAAGTSWVIWLVCEVWLLVMSGEAASPGWTGAACVAKAVAFSVAPGVALAIMLGRGAPGDARSMMAFAGLAIAAVGALGVELTCPLTNPSHLLAWHAGPVVTAVAASWLFGRAMFDRLAAVRVPR